jgi:RND superfamily putative drug exporter
MTITEPKTGRLVRLATWTQRHHWFALVAWLVVVIAIAFAAVSAGTAYEDDHDLPGSESQRVADRLESTTRETALDTVTIVVHRHGGLTDRPSYLAVRDMLDTVKQSNGVKGATDPYLTPGSLSTDHETAISTVTLSTVPEDTGSADVRDLISTAQSLDGDGFRVELGGDSVRAAEESGGPAEGIGILAAIIILIPLFGSALAAAMPLVTALFAVGSAIGVAAVLSNVSTIPSYATPMMALVGLGVGIDYALLVFARYRNEILHGATRDHATRTALDTAGRSVLFAGATVIIALLGMLTLRLGSFQGLALTVALTVLGTMLASITLLPALLTLFGGRLERAILKRADRRRGKAQQGDLWRRLARGVQRFPVPAAVGGVLVLIALSWPALDMRLGFADAGTDPPSSTSRRAYDLSAKAFGAGTNGPPVVLTPDAGAAETTAASVSKVPGVSSVIPHVPVPDAILVIPDTGPASEQTSQLVHRLRDDVLPQLGSGHLVGGSVPAAIDFSDTVAARLPWFIAAVVGLSALLLMCVFRSVLIPLKAAVLNLLSIGAALGVMTYVFGEGHFGAQAGPIEAFLPVIVFAVVFGLSMDYEVFLVSRMHEEWRRTSDSALAVREGLAMTGGVITAAAGIMIVVFGAFVLSADRMLQQMGLGLAVAVLVDALIIRCLVVPAVMRLLGDRAWWLPAWIGRRLPRIELEAQP